MTQRKQLNSNLVSLALDFQHLNGLASFLLLAKDKLEHEDLVNKFETFERYISHMKGLQFRVTEIADSVEDSAKDVEHVVAKQVLFALKELDANIWDLVEHFSIHWGKKNHYDVAFVDGVFGLSNMLQKIYKGCETSFNLDNKQAA